MDIHGLILLNTVNIDAATAVNPIQCILFDQQNNIVQMQNLPEPALYTLAATMTFPNVAPGSYYGVVFRRTVYGDLASPYVRSNDVTIFETFSVATVVSQAKQYSDDNPEYGSEAWLQAAQNKEKYPDNLVMQLSKQSVAPQKQITAPANFVLIAL